MRLPEIAQLRAQLAIELRTPPQLQVESSTEKLDDTFARFRRQYEKEVASAKPNSWRSLLPDFTLKRTEEALHEEQMRKYVSVFVPLSVPVIWDVSGV
jgi:hypothetical protein